MASKDSITNSRSIRRNALEYKTWSTMIQRCTNPKNKKYKDYGGRGIAVCIRWREYDNFIADMGKKPQGNTIERIDNNRNYQLSNCKWATRKEQQNNKRDNRIIEYKGTTKTLSQWGDHLGIKSNTILTRLRRGWSVAESFEKAKRKNKSVEDAKSRRRNCVLCEATFTPRQYQLDHDQGKYCSIKCSLKNALNVRWHGQET